MMPVQVSFQNMPVSDAVEAACAREAEKLLRYYERITACNVTVAKPHRRRAKGSHFAVRIVLDVPQGSVVVNRDPAGHTAYERVDLAVREAFDHARRRLQDHANRLRGKTKRHALQEQGRIVELFPADGYGIVETPEGDRLYLNEKALLQGAFAALQVGDEVRFVSEMGDEGPQATSVRPRARRQRQSG